MISELITLAPRNRWRFILPIALLLSSLALGLLGAVIFNAMGDNVRENPDLFNSISAPVAAALDNPALATLAALPALICAIAALLTGRASPLRMPLIALGYLCLLTALAFILYGFLSLMSPLYQYQPL